MLEFSRHSLARQFLIASFPVLLIGMLVIGFWVAAKIESSVAQRIGGVAGLYVDSFIAPHVQTLADAPDLNEADRVALAGLLRSSALGEKIIAFKIWRPDGKVLYSNNPALIGRTFPPDEGLATALRGETHSEISDLKDDENVYEAQDWYRLIETYIPLHANGKGTVIAAAEFYHSTDELTRESRMARLSSWLVVIATTAAMYLMLFGLVRRGSKTIDTQRRELSDKVYQLTELVAQNNLLHDRVRRAAARTTALNERYLHRLSADLHDGPAQDMGLALMQLDALSREDLHMKTGEIGKTAESAPFRSAYSAMKSAMADLRTISAGLLLPEVAELTPAQVAARAIRDYEQKSGAKVTLNAQEDETSGAAASLPVKITLYRLLQETLSNGFRHAPGSAQHVQLRAKDGQLLVEMRDVGQGFDPSAKAPEGHLGLAGMKERVEILTGVFELDTQLGKGTTVRVTLPLVVPGTETEPQ
jgi:signal transduction histidine kinase